MSVHQLTIFLNELCDQWTLRDLLLTVTTLDCYLLFLCESVVSLRIYGRGTGSLSICTALIPVLL